MYNVNCTYWIWYHTVNSTHCTLYEKNAFGNDFDLGKRPNSKTYTFTFMRFLVGALLEVQNHF